MTVLNIYETIDVRAEIKDDGYIHLSYPTPSDGYISSLSLDPDEARKLGRALIELSDRAHE